MSAILKVKVPFFRRKTSGGSNGIATFYLAEEPRYLPQLNQACLITHTGVAKGSGLANKLSSLSTNVVTGKFQSFEELASQDTIAITDNYKYFFVIEYSDRAFSINQFSGDCAGYIEYDVNPSTLQVLKSVENVAIVNENVPYDLNEGYSQLFCATGNTTEFQGQNPAIFPGMFVRLHDNNTVFANLLKSLNLPVSEEEMKKYTRSELGKLAETQTKSDIVIDGKYYTWTPVATHDTSGVNLTVHPITGYTGEYYGTVLQGIGSTDVTTVVNGSRVSNNSKIPVRNQVALVFEIPQAFYGEIIDGKTMHMKLPFWASTGYTDDSVNIYSFSTTESDIDIYGTYNKNGKNLDNNLSEKDLSLASLGARPDLDRSLSEYESNVVLLFADKVKTPLGDAGRSWAEGHEEVINGAKVYTNIQGNAQKDAYDYNRDVCIGAAYLDKGFIAITHPQIVDSIFQRAFTDTADQATAIENVTGSKTYHFNSPKSGTANQKGLVATVPNSVLLRSVNANNLVEWDNTQWIFSGTTTATELEFLSYNSEKSLNVVCLASADEFYKSTNPTAKELLNIAAGEDYASFKSEDANLYPIMITQIGIHDAEGNLLAVGKPVQPVKKYWFDVVSFNVKIRL